MQQSDIKRLIQDFGPASWVDKSLFGFKDEGWFVLQTIPIPPEDEIKKVISDIIKNHEIAYADGKVRHWYECEQQTHSISNQVVKEVISTLKEESYRIAVCAASDEKYLGGQPIAIALNPTITYMNFPDHPHLNSGGFNKGVFIPNSICYGYTVEPERYGPTQYDKYIRVFDEVTLWAFRHQVWKAIRGKFGKGQWIGRHYKYGFDNPLFYADCINPLLKCRCGKNARYLECHLPLDISEVVKKRAKEQNKKTIDIQNEIINDLVKTWRSRVEIPQTEMLKKMNLMLK